MWPSGRSPFGKSDNSTNSGSVSSSSRERVKRVPLLDVSCCVTDELSRSGIPQIDIDVLIGCSVKSVDGSGTTLGDLGDDARSTSSLSHEVSEAVERTGTFGIGRRRFAVVGRLVGTRFGIGWKSGLCVFNDRRERGRGR